VLYTIECDLHLIPVFISYATVKFKLFEILNTIIFRCRASAGDEVEDFEKAVIAPMNELKHDLIYR